MGGLLVLAGSSAGFAAGPPAASRPALAADGTAVQTTPEHLNDLLAIIEGPNSLHARRTAARELLRLNSPEAVPRLNAVLSRPNRAAKLAVALALSDLPGPTAADYAEALVAMLGDEEVELRRAAATALAGCGNDDVLDRLRQLVGDAQAPPAARLAAIETLGLMTRREAVGILVEALDDQDSAVVAAALSALEQAAAQDFQGSVAAARSWWQAARSASLADWQALQLERLARQSRALARQVQELEQRLAGALREGYYRTAESERPALLNAYLGDAAPLVRCLGLELAQAKLTEGGALAPDTIRLTRELLAAPEPIVRAAAVRTVAALRDPADAERFLSMLATEQHVGVREALVNGLGYVGSASAVEPLLAALASAESTTAAEVVTALGRLAERGVLDRDSRSAVGGALLERLRATPREKPVLRERLLWALSRVADPRCGASFVAALDAAEASAVRLAAVRGIAVLADPKTAAENGAGSQPTTTGPATLTPQQLLDALVPLVNDPDAAVRRTAVETLAQLGGSTSQLEALWGRLSAAQEPEEAVRNLAWRGAVRILSARPVEQVETWLARVPDEGGSAGQRRLELLRAVEQNLLARSAARQELGRIRRRLAAELAEAGQVEAALTAYLSALDDLRSAGSPAADEVALDLLLLALLNGRYDERLAATLVRQNAPLDGHAVWEAVRHAIEQRAQAGEARRALSMLEALRQHPPTSMPADVQQTIQQLIDDLKSQQPAQPEP